MLCGARMLSSLALVYVVLCCAPRVAFRIIKGPDKPTCQAFMYLRLMWTSGRCEKWGVRSGLVMSGVRGGAVMSSDVISEVWEVELWWVGMWQVVMSCDELWWVVMSCDELWWVVMSCDEKLWCDRWGVRSGTVMSWDVISCDELWWVVMRSCDVISGAVMSGDDKSTTAEAGTGTAGSKWKTRARRMIHAAHELFFKRGRASSSVIILCSVEYLAQVMR